MLVPFEKASLPARRLAAATLAIAVIATGWVFAPSAAADTHSAVRSFNVSETAPGGVVTVTIGTSGFGASATVSETLPEGWAYTGSSLSDEAVSAEGSVVSFRLVDEGEFSYTVTAPNAVGTHTFAGMIEDADGNTSAVGGAHEVAVRIDEALLAEIGKLNRVNIEHWVLLNAFRCRFGIDTQLVAGGCVEGAPAYLATSSFSFFRTPTIEEILNRDTPPAAPEVLLNAYRCWFGINTEAVSGGCDDGGEAGEATDSVSVGGWRSFDGFEYNHPDLDRPRQVGVLTESISSVWVAAGASAELRVACFYFDDEEAGTLKGYVNWNTFITSRVGIYDLMLEFSDGQSTAFDAVNSTINEASVLFGATTSTRFAQSMIAADGKTVTASVFIPFGGWTISATFDLNGSAAAIQSVVDSC